MLMLGRAEDADRQSLRPSLTWSGPAGAANLAGQATYYLGWPTAGAANYERAIAALEKIPARYPVFRPGRRSLLLGAYYQELTGDTDAARCAAITTLINKYPHSPSRSRPRSGGSAKPITGPAILRTRSLIYHLAQTRTTRRRKIRPAAIFLKLKPRSGWATGGRARHLSKAGPVALTIPIMPTAPGEVELAGRGPFEQSPLKREEFSQALSNWTTKTGQVWPP